MRSTVRPSWHVILTAALLVALVAAPLVAPAQAADQSLVFEALQVLQTHYVDPVNVTKMLNTAVAGLREQLSAAGIAADLPDIPSSFLESDARQVFLERFATAASAASGQLTKTQLAYAAIRSMTDSFHDSHTGFLTPEQNAERRQRQRGQAGFTGVGIVLLPKDNRFYVWSVIPGGPAEAVGVHEFDRIMKVNDVSTGGLAVDQVAGMIRGPAGTPVTITFQRAGLTNPVVVTMTRAPIVVPSIFRSELLDGGNVAESTSGSPVVAFGQFQQRESAESLARLVRSKGYIAQVWYSRGVYLVVSRPYRSPADAKFWSSVFSNIGLEVRSLVRPEARSDQEFAGVGYIRLYQFVEGTGRDVRNALTRLLAGGMRVLVLDLRGNSGGYLHELDNVLNTLLPFGVPVYTEMLQGGQVEVVRTTRPPLLQPSIPVVLMVDEGSASAAELLAAAIQENHRGVLVGAKTSGAVEASVMIDLSDGSALSVTTFRLATGHGVRLEGAGVEPDVTTAMTVEDLEAGQDRQLTTAVRLARQAVAEPVR